MPVEQLRLDTGWVLLRTKGDPTTNDDAWMAGDILDVIDEDICRRFGASNGHDGRALTGVEVWPVPITSAAVLTQIAAGTGTIELRLIEVVDRGNGTTGKRSVGEADGTPVAVPLNDTAYFPLNGSRQFTIEASTDANYPGGSAALQIWVRAVTR
jgi:hypothetical protein